MRRKTAPDPKPTPESDTQQQDLILLSAAVSNGDDLAPFVRRAFAQSRPESLLQNLKLFSRAKESEIESVCRSHYQDFIRAVDDLRSLLSDADALKSSISDSNSALQSAGRPLLASLDSLLEASSVSLNLHSALSSALACLKTLSLCQKANHHLTDDSLYLALKTVDQIDAAAVPLPTLRRMLTVHIPAVRAHAERKIGKEFSDWMVQIRVASRNLGQVAIGRASAARQREEDLRIKQRQAEEQSRLSSRDLIYALDDDDEDEDVDSSIDLTPLYRAYHIHQTLGLRDRFKKYYFENRKLQLTSDFQVSSMTPFLESHQTFFAQIAGFFIVEDRILRTGGGLVTRTDVDSLWETAVAKMVSVLEDQFSRMMTANHLLLIKDYVSLLGVTLRRYGYAVDPLLDVLSKHRDKYHDLLLNDCRRQISEALAADKFEQMLMKKEYEYSMNVLSFQIQTSDITPAFPFVAPFSSTVPDCCRIVRSFIEDSVSFMSYGGQLDFYAIVKKYLDRLLVEALDSSLLRLVESQSLGVSQAMQVEKYMKNTHAKTHSNYTVDIEQILRVTREGEVERFGKFSSVKNRMLLWHGSRLSNWTGILSQGLRIAPPEAPSTGYMFGKGVYFADMFSKSANYCFSTKECSTGVLLLCEVALGGMAELLAANYNADRLPDGKLSTKGVGATAPDMSEAESLEDGLVVPLGKPKEQTGQKGSLMYNEYIVYNVEQIRMRYVVQVNFRWNAR